jgi:hypothetical protein
MVFCWCACARACVEGDPAGGEARSRVCLVYARAVCRARLRPPPNTRPCVLGARALRGSRDSRPTTPQHNPINARMPRAAFAAVSAPVPCTRTTLERHHHHMMMMMYPHPPTTTHHACARARARQHPHLRPCRARGARDKTRVTLTLLSALYLSLRERG